MTKIKAVGNCFVQVGDSLINLNAYKEIKKYKFGYEEDPETNSAYGIMLIPLCPNEKSIKNGVDGSFFITTYTQEEHKEFEADFEEITSSLKD